MTVDVIPKCWSVIIISINLLETCMYLIPLIVFHKKILIFSYICWLISWAIQHVGLIPRLWASWFDLQNSISWANFQIVGRINLKHTWNHPTICTGHTIWVLHFHYNKYVYVVLQTKINTINPWYGILWTCM